MVGIAPYVERNKLSEWCGQLQEIGLGRIDYKAVNIVNWEGETDYKGIRKISVYITKYLTKDRRSARTWGILRKSNLRTATSPHEPSTN